MVQLNACANVVQDGRNILCKNCNNIIGCVVENTFQGMFVELFNVHLVRFQPSRLESYVEDSTQSKLTASYEHVQNHLKRKADVKIDNEEFVEKRSKPNNTDPIILMRVSVSSDDSDPSLSLPYFDLDDNFSDISDFEYDTNIGLDHILPFLNGNDPMFSVPGFPNNIWPDTSLITEIDSDAESEFDDSDSEIVSYTPPGKCD